MNIHEQENIRSPSGNDDICAKFTIDTVDEPFVLHDIAEVGQEYTLSFWCYSETGGEITAGNVDMPTSSSWARYVVTFMSDSVHVPIYFNIVGTYHIYNAQLEIGCKDTDFALNPADTEEDVAALAVVVNSHSTQFTVMDGKIAGLIEENITIRGEYDTLVSRATEMQADLDGITTRVSMTETDLASIENRVTSAESQIIQHADEIALAVKEENITGDYLIGKINLDSTTAQIEARNIKLSATDVIHIINSGTTKIEASKLDLSGYVTVTSLASAGQTTINGANITTGLISADRIDVGALFTKEITATNLHVTGNSVFDGTLRATKGTIGGWNIGSNSIDNTNSSGNYVILMNGTNTNQDVLVVRTGAGTTASPHSWPVYIRANGQVGFSNANITGTITAKSLTAYDSISMRSSDGVINKVIGYSSSGQFWLGGTPSGATTQLTTIYGPVTVYGDATHSVLTSGKIQTEDIDITRDYSGSWINALQGHAAINISQAGSSSGFNALARVMTTNGAWTIGTLNSNNGFYIAYGNATRLANGANGADSDFAVLANGDVYVRGMIEFKDWNGTKRSPISSASTDSNRVSYIASKKNDNGTYYITVQGQFGTTGSTYVAKNISTNTSDVRLKCNIVDTKVAALPVINQMAIRAFDWLESGIHRRIGFVADELEAIDPALAFGGGYDEYGDMIEKNVDVFYLAGYLTKGIQELYSAQVEHTDRILTLEARLDEQMSINEYLMDENAKLKKRVAQLEEQQAA